MATISHYSGYMGSCPIEVAERDDGRWFWRERHFNGYGVGWSKWKPLSKTPTHPTRLRHRVEAGGAPEYIDIPEDERHLRVDFGFSVLSLIPGPYRIRLPKAD